MNYDNLINDNGIFLYKDISFNTIYYELKFVAEAGNRESAILELLSMYLTKKNKNYKTEKELGDKKKELYDAQISASVTRCANTNNFDICMDIVSFSAVNDDYSSELNNLFYDVVFNPCFDDENLLDVLKRVYINTLSSILIEPDEIADRLYNKNEFVDNNRLFYTSTDINYISELINSVTLEDLKKTYEKLLNNFNYGFVFGNITDEQFNKFRNKIPFKANKIVIDKEQRNNIVENDLEIEAMDTNESIIYVTYTIDNMNDEIYNLLINMFNTHCGLCNQILREKYGLVYTSEINIDYYNKQVIFYTKIDKKNKEKLLNAIDEIIDYAANPDKINGLLDYAKEKAIQEEYVLGENKGGIIEDLRDYIVGNKTEGNPINNINKYTKEDISTLIKTLKRKNIFMYRGDNNE